MSAAATATLLCLVLIEPKNSEAWRPDELRVKKRIPAQTFEELRDLALVYVGRPYGMGGVGSPDFDCSGFTCRVFAEAGYAIPRVSRDQARAGRAVPKDMIAPGDLLFFAEEDERISHVGIYLGDRELLHASSGDGEVGVANLDSKWFRDRFKSARRILATTGTVAAAVASVELVEHEEDALLPMLNRPVRALRPSYGPQLSGARKTAIAVRSGLLTEEGVLGLIIAPEASFYLRAIALELALSLPIRFELNEKVTIGEVNSAKDLTRYVRTIALGLRGADLEIRLSQLGDLTLGHGLVVDKVTPGSLASGVPGFSITRAPLSLYAFARTELGSVQALADDAVDPKLAALSVRSGTDLFSVMLGLATDQHTRAINALEGEVEVEVIDTRHWSVDVSGGAAMMRALGTNGGLAIARASVQYRHAALTTSAVTFGARGGYLGRGTLDSIFSATYLANREEHLEALTQAQPRPFLGGETYFHAGRLIAGALFEDALGTNRLGFDRRLDALLALEGLRLWGTTLLDLRVAYASRGVFRTGPTEHSLHANLGVRFSSWMSLEVYAVQGARLEGGGAVSLRFEP